MDNNLFRGMDPKIVEKVEPFLEGLWKHYFRCEISGWENIPRHKALFVGNHNGLLAFEVLMLFHAWKKHFGTTKKALGLAHSVALNNPFFKWLIPKLGAIPASPEIADEALRRDFSLLVFPGGEKEAFRPFTERKKIDFYGRKGFIKLALRNKVPLVPIVSIGAHESYIILHRGEELAEALGLKKKFRLHGMPITFRSVFFMWCLTTGIFTFFPLLLAPWAFIATFIPLPAKMQFVILPAIDVVKEYDKNLSEEANIDNIYQLILSKMQHTLSAEYSKRALPILG